MLFFRFNARIAVIFLLPRICFAQNIDSLVKSLQMVSDSEYVRNCNEISYYTIVNKKNVKLGFQYSDSALIRSAKIKSARWEGYTYNNIGNIYNYLSDLNKALDNLERAEQLYRKINYPAGYSNVLVNKGNTYFYFGDFGKAEKSYRLALEILIKDSLNDQYIANLYNNLGSVCAQLKRDEEANQLFSKAVEINSKNNDYLSLAYTYNNLGSLANTRKKYEEGLLNFKRALELKLIYGDNSDKADAYKNISTSYYNMDDYHQSLEYLKLSLKYIDVNVYNSKLKTLYELFASTYEKLNDLKSANEYHKLLANINKEIFEKEIEEQLKQKEITFDFAKSHLTDSLMQASQIEKQKSEIARSSSIRNVLLLTVGIVIVFLLLLYKRFKVSQAQKNEISLQKHLVEEKQKEILSSIAYAQRIQRSLLPTEKYIDRIFKKNKSF